MAPGLRAATACQPPAQLQPLQDLAALWAWEGEHSPLHAPPQAPQQAPQQKECGSHKQELGSHEQGLGSHKQGLSHEQELGSHDQGQAPYQARQQQQQQHCQGQAEAHTPFLVQIPPVSSARAEVGDTAGAAAGSTQQATAFATPGPGPSQSYEPRVLLQPCSQLQQVGLTQALVQLVIAQQQQQVLLQPCSQQQQTGLTQALVQRVIAQQQQRPAVHASIVQEATSSSGHIPARSATHAQSSVQVAVAVGGGEILGSTGSETPVAGSTGSRTQGPGSSTGVPAQPSRPKSASPPPLPPPHPTLAHQMLQSAHRAAQLMQAGDGSGSKGEASGSGSKGEVSGSREQGFGGEGEHGGEIAHQRRYPAAVHSQQRQQPGTQPAPSASTHSQQRQVTAPGKQRIGHTGGRALHSPAEAASYLTGLGAAASSLGATASCLGGAGAQACLAAAGRQVGQRAPAHMRAQQQQLPLAPPAHTPAVAAVGAYASTTACADLDAVRGAVLQSVRVQRALDVLERLWPQVCVCVWGGRSYQVRSVEPQRLC